MKEKLYRSRIDRVFGGVCSGLAKYMNIDTILIRIIFIILAFFNGIGILIYIIMWIVVPEDPLFFSHVNPAEEPSPGNINDSTTNETEPSNKDENRTYESKSSYQYPPFPPTSSPKNSNGSGRLIVGIIFIGLGLVFLADRIFPYFDFEDFIPLLFVFIGIGLLWNSLKKRD